MDNINSHKQASQLVFPGYVFVSDYLFLSVNLQNIYIHIMLLIILMKILIQILRKCTMLIFCDNRSFRNFESECALVSANRVLFYLVNIVSCLINISTFIYDVQKEAQKSQYNYMKWKPPSLGELTPMIFNTGLTHLGSEASKYVLKLINYSKMSVMIIRYFLYVFFSR